MSRQQKILLIAIVTVGTILVIFGARSARRTVTPSGSTTTTKTTSLTISNDHTYFDQIDTATFEAIEKAVSARIAHYGKPGNYVSSIRKDSFSQNTNEYDGTDPPTQVPSVQFLLDIPTAKQSYYVSFSGGPGYPYNILNVTCPDTNALIYGDFGCVDQ